jgi:hypothetical protein
MKKVMSIAAVALMIAGTSVYAGECGAKKSGCTKDKSECSSEKSKECTKDTSAKQCTSNCSGNAKA